MTLTIISILIGFITLLYFISLWIGSKHKLDNSNTLFFNAGRRKNWVVVAISMVGATLSGVTLISVPGMVLKNEMFYFQMTLGFFAGYIVIAILLLPVYYKLKTVSIYSYIKERFGNRTHRVGVYLFIVSGLFFSATRLYIVLFILCKELNISMWIISLGMLCCIWLYTHKNGIKAVLYTDLVQTVLFVIALITIILTLFYKTDLPFGEIFNAWREDEVARMFSFSWDRNNFWLAFIFGMLVTVAMTGLNQDMMQKNLICNSLRASQKNMLLYGLFLIPVILILLFIGWLSKEYLLMHEMLLPDKGDTLLTSLVFSGDLGQMLIIVFILALLTASLSSVDSAIIALTTTYCLEIKKVKDDKEGRKVRKKVYIIFFVLLYIGIMVLDAVYNDNIIMLILSMASYIYAPLMGLFTIGLFSKWRLKEGLSPYVFILTPIMTYLIKIVIERTLGYNMTVEILFLGYFIALWLFIAILKNNKDAQKVEKEA